MKNIIIIVLLGAAGVWYFFGNNNVSRSEVKSVYSDYFAAFSADDQQALCDIFAENFTGTFNVHAGGQVAADLLSKDKACQSRIEFNKLKSELEKQANKELYVNTSYTFLDIAIADDKKSATATMTTEYRIGDESKAWFDMRSEHTDVIKKNKGKAQIVQSNGETKFY